MNSTDKRIEELLNRGGQTISDLPKDYSDEMCMRAYACVQQLRSEYKLSSWHECLKYILHLTDIIDRFEWALENVCGERDYLRKVIEKEVPCLICVTKECRAYDEPCNSCLQPGGETMVNYEYAGVPEDWRVDDEKGL